MALKIYVAGKISGDPEYRKKSGLTARHITRAARIANMGSAFWTMDVQQPPPPVVLNPAELPESMTAGDYMKICFAMIDAADFVIFLPEWTESKGAQLEKAYCDYIAKPHGTLPRSWWMSLEEFNG